MEDFNTKQRINRLRKLIANYKQEIERRKSLIASAEKELERLLVEADEELEHLEYVNALEQLDRFNKNLDV